MLIRQSLIVAVVLLNAIGTPASAQQTVPLSDVDAMARRAELTKQIADAAKARQEAEAGLKALEPAAPKPDIPSGDEQLSGNDIGKFGGIEFGVGVSLTIDMGNRDRIAEAELDGNGFIRVSDENNSRARIMLESHYFFTSKGNLFGAQNIADVGETAGVKRWGFGPFVALQPGSDNVIDAIGGGIMVGFRRNATTSESFNFGIGYVVDPNTRVLGDGLTANMRLPAGEMGIRYKETAQSGILLLASFGF